MCVNQIKKWETMRNDLIDNKNITHERSRKYAALIMEAIEAHGSWLPKYN